MNDTELIEALRPEHILIDQWGCGAVSVPVWRSGEYHPRTEEHGKWQELTLRCTENGGHEGDHKDGAHCWAPHRFTASEVDHFEPQDRRKCSCGRSWDGCLTGRLLARHATEPES